MFSNSHGSGNNADKVAPSKLSSKLKIKGKGQMITFHFTFICTECALRRPMTYDNQSHPSHPIRHRALNELNRPNIDLSVPSMTQYELR